MKKVQILALIISIGLISCSILQVGVPTVIYYDTPHNKAFVEKALVDVQYCYPEIRCLPQMYDGEDKIYHHPLNYVFTKEDSLYLNQKIKDYYRNATGAKVFILSPNNKDIRYSLRVLNSEPNNSAIGIVFLEYKWKSVYLETINKTERDSLIHLFEKEILPKIQMILKMNNH